MWENCTRRTSPRLRLASPRRGFPPVAWPGSGVVPGPTAAFGDRAAPLTVSVRLRVHVVQLYPPCRQAPPAGRAATARRRAAGSSEMLAVPPDDRSGGAVALIMCGRSNPYDRTCRGARTLPSDSTRCELTHAPTNMDMVARRARARTHTHTYIHMHANRMTHHVPPAQAGSPGCNIDTQTHAHMRGA